MIMTKHEKDWAEQKSYVEPSPSHTHAHIVFQ